MLADENYYSEMLGRSGPNLIYSDLLCSDPLFLTTRSNNLSGGYMSREICVVGLSTKGVVSERPRQKKRACWLLQQAQESYRVLYPRFQVTSDPYVRTASVRARTKK